MRFDMRANNVIIKHEERHQSIHSGWSTERCPPFGIIISREDIRESYKIRGSGALLCLLAEFSHEVLEANIPLGCTPLKLWQGLLKQFFIFSSLFIG
jgi:hypothetical protein